MPSAHFKALATLLLLVLLPGAPATAAPPPDSEPRHVLRLATLLPNGTSWMKEFRRLAHRVEQKSKGKLQLKIYGNAVMGDERDVVKKMERGQLQGAAVTSVGLGLIYPEVRVLELPRLFETTREVDAVRAALEPRFKAGFEKSGYVLLGWGDLGWINVFFGQVPRTVEDYRRLKFWSWVDDPIARGMVRKLGAKSVALGIQDVLPALQTGLVDTFYCSPYATLALQWHTEAQAMLKQPVTYAVGALVVTGRAFKKLPPALQQLLLAESQTTARRFTQHSRRDNRQAQKHLLKNGIRLVTAPSQVQKELKEKSTALWHDMVGKLFEKDLLERVLQLLAQTRD